MPKPYFEEHSQQPRKADKKKHRKGFNEDVQESRAQRVNFKRYVRALEEQLQEQLEDYDEADH